MSGSLWQTGPVCLLFLYGAYTTLESEAAAAGWKTHQRLIVDDGDEPE